MSVLDHSPGSSEVTGEYHLPAVCLDSREWDRMNCKSSLMSCKLRPVNGRAGRRIQRVNALSGQPFQPSKAAVNGVNAAIGVAVAAITARTQATAAAVAASAAGFANQDDTAAGALAAVPQVMVV